MPSSSARGAERSEVLRRACGRSLQADRGIAGSCTPFEDCGRATRPPDCPLVVPFTPVSEIEKAVARCLASIDFEAIARKTVQEHLERLAGRV